VTSPPETQYGLHLPPGESFPIHTLARVLSCTRQHLINLVETGEIKCAIDLRGAGSSHSCIRITRAAALEFIESRRIEIAAIPDRLDGREEKSATARICRADTHRRKN
jgi:hypothetical protein